MYELICTMSKNISIEEVLEAKATGIIMGDDFHATRIAHVFDLDTISKYTKLAHENKLKVYIKMNRMYTDIELERAKEYLIFLKDIGVDNIFFNDLSIYVLAKRMNLENKLVYDPDTILTNSLDANYHLSKNLYGLVLSKEITKEEMLAIAGNVKGNIGVIIHGYLNMSYSKRHLITSYLDFINKKEDIYNKRDLYLVEETRDGKMPIIEDSQGTMIFTSYVQESFEEVKELYEAGINILIVDGIFLEKGPILDALRAYSSILDGQGVKGVKEAYYSKYDLPLSTGYMEKATNLVK